MEWFYVALGSAVGGLARHWVNGWITQQTGGIFPLGTLMVNASGSLIMGMLGALTVSEGRWALGPGSRSLLMVGMLGGYTTFSAFSYQTLILLKSGQWILAATNMLLSLVLCVALTALGFWIATALNR